MGLARRILAEQNQWGKVLVEKYDGHTKEKLTDAKLMDTLTYTVTNLASKQTTELTEKNNWEASFVPGDYQIVETNRA